MPVLPRKGSPGTASGTTTPSTASVSSTTLPDRSPPDENCKTSYPPRPYSPEYTTVTRPYSPDYTPDRVAGRPSLPSYILEHAPLVHLHSKEPFLPASLETHIKNCHPSRSVSDRGPLHHVPSDLFGTFKLLSHYDVNHEACYMTAKDKARSTPNVTWLASEEGRPDEDGKAKAGGCCLVVVEKPELGPGTVDAFWFFFYSFNLGPTVLNIHFGNHVADWEHCMIRFVNEQPQAMHLSSHADGFAYEWSCMEKQGNRPVIFSAHGSHAMYPKPGKHDYSPVKHIGPIDHTDRGPLWDPSLNFHGFSYNPTPARDEFTAYEEKDVEVVHCLRFRGKWGDKISMVSTKKHWLAGLGLEHTRRALLLQHLRWGDGCTGPRDKSLDRPGMNRWNNHVRSTF